MSYVPTALEKLQAQKTGLPCPDCQKKFGCIREFWTHVEQAGCLNVKQSNTHTIDTFDSPIHVKSPHADPESEDDDDSDIEAFDYPAHVESPHADLESEDINNPDDIDTFDSPAHVESPHADLESEDIDNPDDIDTFDSPAQVAHVKSPLPDLENLKQSNSKNPLYSYNICMTTFTQKLGQKRYQESPTACNNALILKSNPDRVCAGCLKTASGRLAHSKDYKNPEFNKTPKPKRRYQYLNYLASFSTPSKLRRHGKGVGYKLMKTRIANIERNSIQQLKGGPQIIVFKVTPSLHITTAASPPFQNSNSLI
jgi:hypothetical protein